MKTKIAIVLMAFIALPLLSAAQENDTKIEVGISGGFATFTNYPALSVFADATDSYTVNSQALYAGYRFGKNLMGLQLQNINNMSTSRNEDLTAYAIQLMARHYGSLGEKLEPFCGLKLGMSVMNTYYPFSAEVNSMSRNGFVCEWELGLSYKVSKRSFFGITAGISAEARLTEKTSLPTGFTEFSANSNTKFGYHTLMMAYGLRF